MSSYPPYNPTQYDSNSYNSSPNPFNAHKPEHQQRVPDDVANDEPSFNMKDPSTWKILFTRKNLPYTIGAIIYLAIVIVFAILNNKIVHALQPAANWMKDHPGGWLIPVALIAVLSIPPLIGHEIIAILVGVTWGLWIGWGIVCAGTFIGEIITFFMSKYLFRKKTEKLARTNVRVATLAHILSSHSWKVILAVRYSFIPAHLSTALFASLGMSFTTFVLTAIPVFPKLLLPVSLGTMLAPDQTTSQRTLHTVILIISIALSVFGYIYVRRLLKAAEPQVREEVRQHRAAERGTHNVPLARNVSPRSSNESLGEYAPSAHVPQSMPIGAYTPPSGPPPSIPPVYKPGGNHGRNDSVV